MNWSQNKSKYGIFIAYQELESIPVLFQGHMTKELSNFQGRGPRESISLSVPTSEVDMSIKRHGWKNFMQYWHFLSSNIN
jgi:hypothetical protein